MLIVLDSTENKINIPSVAGKIVSEKGFVSEIDIVTGDWRTLNLQIAPFYFPTPVKVIAEDCMQNNGLYKDKSLALFEKVTVQQWNLN